LRITVTHRGKEGLAPTVILPTNKALPTAHDFIIDGMRLNHGFGR